MRYPRYRPPHIQPKSALLPSFVFAACEPMLPPRNPPKTLLCVHHTRIDAAHTSPESKCINSPLKHPPYDCLHMCNGPSISEASRPHCFTFHRHCFPRVLASQKIIDDSEDPTPPPRQQNTTPILPPIYIKPPPPPTRKICTKKKLRVHMSGGPINLLAQRNKARGGGHASGR